MAAQTRPTAGDHTGQLKAKAAREQRLAQQDQSAQGLVDDNVRTEEELHAVHDPQPGAVIGSVDGAAPYTTVIVDERTEQDRFFRAQSDDEPILTGQESEEELAPILARRAVTSAPTAPRVRRSIQKVRIAEDVEQMTYGMRNGVPNNFDFREGLVYEVSADLADHLNERGLVRAFVS